jgi:Domain of unknown function (DUF4272)
MSEIVLQEFLVMSQNSIRAVPKIDMSDLEEIWPGLAPAERRLVYRERLLGQDRTLLARLKKRFGFARKITPPTVDRIAARSLALAAIVARAVSEQSHQDGPGGQGASQQWTQQVARWRLAKEFEPPEARMLKTPLGKLPAAFVQAGIWRKEGLAVLAWSLGLDSRPIPNQPVNPHDLLAKLRCGDLESPAALAQSARQRSPQEISLFAAQATLITWRLRTYRLSPGPWDFAGHLRRQTGFQEDWLTDLPLSDGELTIDNVPITSASPEQIQTAEGIALERHLAAYWLQGDDPIYSKVDPATLLSAL